MEERFPILACFAYQHLPDHLQPISKPFHDLAHEVAGNAKETRLSGMETSTCLRKLREAKDCAVTAFL